MISTFTDECPRKMADEETFKLIESWGEDSIQAKLEGCKRKKDVYLTISKKMNEAGYEKTT